ncbi:MAG: cupin domain-containing protein [Pseudonocardiaceae bacterium]
MISTTTASPSRTIGAGGQQVRWRCLARRGMLHSECESIDHLRVPAHAEFGPRGTQGVESVWFVLGGAGSLLDDGWAQDGYPVRPGQLVLVPAACPVRLLAGENGLELLWLAVLPEEVSRMLPVRKPVVS